MLLMSLGRWWRKVVEVLVSSLARVTSRGEYIAEVDGIRFVAISLVLVFHAVMNLLASRGALGPDWSLKNGELVRCLASGWYGVEIFFVLSGFVVGLPFARSYLGGAPAPELRSYYLRRLTRLEPPYLLSLLALFLLAGTRENGPHLLASIFYSHSYLYGSSNPFAPVTWSLEVEAAFYLIAPLLAGIYRIRADGLRWTCGLMLTVGYAYAAGRWMPQVIHDRAQIITTLQFFFTGMLLADLYVCGVVRRVQTWAGDLAVVAAALALFRIVDATQEKQWTWYWTGPFWILLLFAGVLSGRVFQRLLSFRPVTLIGGMCYTLYLWHPALNHFLAAAYARPLIGLVLDQAVLACLAIVIPATILLCIPLFLLLEKPFMNGPGSRAVQRLLGFAVRADRSPGVA
jgi:peptidoglycan/LPS O-acetylase OafA/YrhL